MRESNSWSKPDNVLGLIGRKHVDWSILEYGSTIPSEFHEDFDFVNGIHVERGGKRKIKVIYKGQSYNASLVNIDRKSIKSDTYQIRYDSNKELKDILVEVFSFSYKFLNAARKKGQLEGKKKVYALVPNEQAEFIDFCSTGKPFEYELKLHPFIEKDLYDENYQEEIDNSFINKKVEYEDKPKDKPSKTSLKRNAFKRDRTVGRNAIITADFQCEFDKDHKNFISKVTGENYVEAHHLIPIEYQENFDVSIDVESNVVSLCVICHKKLHHAIFNEKQEILNKLYKQRKDRLELCEILITKEMIFDLYS